jgi:hypothetical protein
MEVGAPEFIPKISSGCGKSWENHQKIMRKSWENMGRPNKYSAL